MATSTQPIKTVPAPKQMISPSNVTITKNVPPPPTDSQKSAQSWINNPSSGQGGMDTYSKVQNDRWTTANKNSDYDMMKKLQSDSQRVGYTLNPYTPPTPNTTAPKEFADWQAKQGELMTKYEQMMNTPFQYNPETDPGYQAQRQLAQLRAGDATRSAMETLNDRGILNSSITGSQLGQIQQRAEQEAAAYIPQYRDQARQDYQDRLRNAGEMLKFAAGRGDIAYQNEYTRGRDNRADMVADRTYDRGIFESDRDYDRRVLEGDRTSDLATRSADLNQTQVMAALTGFMPDGTPTNAQQQQQLQNAWREAEQFGQVTPTLAQLTGIPEGTPTMAAQQQAFNQSIQREQQSLQNRQEDRLLAQANTSAERQRSASEPKSTTLQDVSKYANSVARYKDGTLLNPDQVESAILSYDLPEEEYRKLYATHGLKWGG